MSPGHEGGLASSDGAAAETGLHGKRVLLLFPHMVLPGGALNYMLKLAEILAGNGVTVGILTLQADRQKYERVAGAELLTVGGPLTSNLGYWLLYPYWQMKINRMIREWHADVLVPQVFPANWWAWLYKRRNRDARIVWVCHEPSAFIHSPEWIHGLKPFWKRFLAKCLQPLLAVIDLRLALQSDRVITNSRYTERQFELVYGWRSEGVAYPGIDLSLFYPGDLPRERALITVAHLTRYKRVDFLLQVFSRLKESHPELVYHIVGEGDESEELRSLAHKLGIADSVIFHGRLSHDELAVLHRRMMLFLHGGVNETFGMAPLEAIACGTPVIAHRSGGPTEFVTDACGRLIDSLSEERWSVEISEFLAMLEANPAYFMGVSENARKFSWESTLAPVVKLIPDLCA